MNFDYADANYVELIYKAWNAINIYFILGWIISAITYMYMNIWKIDGTYLVSRRSNIGGTQANLLKLNN